MLMVLIIDTTKSYAKQATIKDDKDVMAMSVISTSYILYIYPSHFPFLSFSKHHSVRDILMDFSKSLQRQKHFHFTVFLKKT